MSLRHKGKSITLPLQDFTVVDLETTGLDPRYDEIIEVAALKCRSGEVVDSFNLLVKPKEPVSGFITDLTGITNEMLSSADPVEKVLPQYLAFIGSDVVLAHNANFDINFIYDTCAAMGLSPFENDYIDTLRISRYLYRLEKHHRLRDMLKLFGIKSEGAHRGLVDCRSALACYKHMLPQIPKDGIKITHSTSARACNISATTDSFDETHMLYGRSCVFTGVLDKMTRKEAMQIVVDLGGLCEDNVTKNTNYLILGNNDYCKAIKDGKSNKQKKAEKYKLAGNDIEIITEDVFYDMIEM